MNWPKGGWVWGRPEKGPWPLPSETPLRRKTGSPSPNQEPSTPWRGRSHGGDHRARVRKDEACPAEEWPRTQTPHLDMFRARSLSLSHTHPSLAASGSQSGAGDPIPLLACLPTPSTPLPARAAQRRAAGAAAAGGLRTHHRIRTSARLAPANPGPAGPRPAPGL